MLYIYIMEVANLSYILQLRLITCIYMYTMLWCLAARAKDTHIMLFKVPIMLCSISQHQPFMLIVLCLLCSQFCILICDDPLENLYFITLFHRKDKVQPYYTTPHSLKVLCTRLPDYLII